MMQVKPALFDKVLANIHNLVAVRGDSIYPSIVVQFLIDRKNVDRIVEMYELGRSLNPDRIAINAVLEIPFERIDRSVILHLEDNVVAEPQIEEILRRDKEERLLQIDFPYPQWNEMLQRTRARVGTVPHNNYPVADSFKGENAGCFFAWYSAAITGNGDIRPCCLLLNPTVKPLVIVHDKPQFADHWNGPEFSKMRDEMREVLLMKSKKPYTPQRFEILKEQCVLPHMCYLKTMYFQGDQEFYAELDQALTKVRKKEIRFVFGNNVKRKRAIELYVQEHPRVKKAWDWFRENTRPMRIQLKQRLGINLTDAV
jgi:hypothetical protein